MSFFQKQLVLQVFRLRLFYLISIPAMVSSVLLIAYFSGIKDFPVFPNNKIFDYHTYDDAGAGGNSKIIVKFVTDSLIKLEFQISNQISNPYVGLNIAAKDGKTINLEHYNELKIKLNGNELNGISLALITENSLIKSDGQRQDVLFFQSFNISPGTKTYTIKLDNFKVPDWWSEYNRVENASAIQPDLKNLKALNVSCAYTPSIDKTHSIDIYAMAFSRNNKPVFMLITALVFIFVIIVFIVVYATEKIKTNRKVITIAYKPVENNTTENSKSDFIVFINNNFQNCDLTLDFVSGETGVSQRRITNEVQNRFGCNFKTYINRLRLNESKRLLQNKDLNIGEIAFKVGFNNQSHFNRVFKAEFHISPTEFRDKIRE
jgi:AraC-like DNA-binding protein